MAVKCHARANRKHVSASHLQRRSRAGAEEEVLWDAMGGESRMEQGAEGGVRLRLHSRRMAPWGVEVSF